MFSFSLISGDPEEVLSDGNSVVLTESMARKYCGSINPIGQTITITFGQIDKDFLVTGVSSKSPGNSSIQFDMLIHISNLPIATNDPPVLNNWRMWYFPLYVQLSDDAEIDHVEEKLDVFCAQFFEPVIQRQRDSGSWLRDGLPFTFRLQRIQDVYLDTRGLTPSIILSAIALIILTIAWVNFMNISVGLSSTRSKEVGVRKVAGAHRKQLMVQFWTEAVLTSLIGVVVGFLLTSVFLPKFNLLSGKQLLFSSFFQASHITALLLLIFISGLVAGSYPALVMSNFRPIDMLKHRLRIGGKTGYTRIMVVIQFSLTAVLIISSVVLGNQARFLIRKDLGYDEQGLVVVMTQENEQEASERLYARYRNRIILNSRVKSVTACTREFGLFLPGTSLEVDGRNIHYHYTRVDPHFVSTMGLKIVQGRDFEPEFQTDMNTVLVNERFIRELGSEFEVESFLDPSGQDFPNSCRVVGVIEDVHFLSLRSEIEPLLLYTGKGFSPARDRFSLIVLRIETDQILETREFLARAWKEIQPEKPFELVFLDESLENQYTREKRWSTIVMSSSALSILIACLGILGLTALIITRRTKEIGIRKVFGAKSLQIVLMIVSEFCALVGLANLIAWPVAFVTMQTVLSNYPYRTGLSIWVFLITGLGTVLLAILTIGYLAMKAALSNPVQTLRYE